MLKSKSYIALFLLSCFSLWQLSVNHTHHDAHSKDSHSELHKTSPKGAHSSVEEVCPICDFYVPLAESPLTCQIAPFSGNSHLIITLSLCSPTSTWAPHSKNKSPPIV